MDSKKEIQEEIKKLFEFSDDNEKLEFEKDILQIDFMEYISELMEESGMSQKSLAELIGKSPSWVSQLFSCDKRINIDTVIGFQRVFKTNFSIVKKTNDVEMKKVKYIPIVISKESCSSSSDSGVELPLQGIMSEYKMEQMMN